METTNEETTAQQSPVDISGYIEGCAEPALRFHYSKTAADHIENTGDFVKIKYQDCGGILLNGREYPLKEVHTHNPSEHTINGKRFSIEAHLVHIRTSGEIAVVGVLYQIGDPNAAIQALIDNSPAQGEDDATPISPLTAVDFLPEDSGYYRYTGSLTTPPYTEGVQWLVMAEALNISTEQISQLAALTGGGTNNRALQPLNGRQITHHSVR